MKNIGLLALRLAVGFVFIRHGYSKLEDMEKTITMFTNLKLLFPLFWAYFITFLELIGGFMIILGVYTRFFALLLAVNMVFAIFLVHTKLPFGTWELPLSMLGACLALKGCGGGEYSLLKTECVCGATNDANWDKKK